MSWFRSCKHQWKVLSDTTIPSGVENLSASGHPGKHFYVGMTVRKHVAIVACETCGEIRKFETEGAS